MPPGNINSEIGVIDQKFEVQGFPLDQTGFMGKAIGFQDGTSKDVTGLLVKDGFLEVYAGDSLFMVDILGALEDHLKKGGLTLKTPVTSHLSQSEPESDAR